MIQKIARRPISPLKVAMRGVFWLVTPWRMPQRYTWLRAQAAVRRKDARMAAVALSSEGSSAAQLDLFDDEACARTAGLPRAALLWPAVDAERVTDRWGAARFVIDLWRRDKGLRDRLPRGWIGGSEAPLAIWLRSSEGRRLGLDDAAMGHVESLWRDAPSVRARQFYLANVELTSLLPHGLTPAGRARLFSWLMQEMRDGDVDLRPEEVWWLFLGAEQAPEDELRLAHAFTPQWQHLHPAGTTVFGADAFSAWLAASYGAQGEWLDPANWRFDQDPAEQLRVAYLATPEWRGAHPRALEDVAGALGFLAWLGSADAGLGVRPRRWCAELDVQVVAPALCRRGANVLGHFCYPSGLRVSAESMVEAMRLAGRTPALRDVSTDFATDEPHHVQYGAAATYPVSIIHVQPEPFFDEAWQRAQVVELSGTPYRIGYWYWEFDTVPEEWAKHAQGLDEVWAATEFVARGLRKRLPIPVHTLFPGVKLTPYTRRGKQDFGLDEGKFTFLFTFHMMSVMERKNPLGLIRAFRKAFMPHESAGLVLKTSFGDRHPQQLRELREAAAGANITVIDQVMSPDEVLSLMDACDAYVSLHRSEGLGLTIAEAMLMGKPVIATNFSGNEDFMNEDNSLPVRYSLVRLGRAIPPYSADLEWAQPDEAHAAARMRRLFDDQEAARRLGQRARESALAHLSLEAAGRRFESRLTQIEAGL